MKFLLVSIVTVMLAIISTPAIADPFSDDVEETAEHIQEQADHLESEGHEEIAGALEETAEMLFELADELAELSDEREDEEEEIEEEFEAIERERDEMARELEHRQDGDLRGRPQPGLARRLRPGTARFHLLGLPLDRHYRRSHISLRAREDPALGL